MQVKSAGARKQGQKNEANTELLKKQNLYDGF